MKNYSKDYSMKAMLLITALVGSITSVNAGAKRVPVTDNYNRVDPVLVDFAPGDYSLPQEARQRISQIVTRNPANEKVWQVQLAAWADKSNSWSNFLSVEDRYLAERRAEGVMAHLKLQHGIYASAFNMGDRGNYLVRAFDSNQTELQSSYSKFGEVQQAGSPMTSQDVALFKQYGQPGRVVVLVKRQPIVPLMHSVEKTKIL